MRPKLKPDTYWVPNPDGVSFVHPSGHLNVKGHNALLLMDRLAPYLDGGVSLEELVSGLPEGKEQMVTSLVTALRDAGLVKDATDEEPHGLTDQELELYAAEIAYIDYYTSSAARRFERFRRTPAVCVGSGLTLLALVHAALNCGLHRLTVVVTDDEATDTARLHELIAQRRQRDPDQEARVRLLDGGADAAADLAAEVAQAGLTLHAADSADPERARRIDRQCREAGTVAVHGMVVGGDALVGPITHPGSHGWESMWLRRAATRPHPRGADPFAAPAGPPSVYLAGPTASLVANRVAFFGLRHLSGVADTDPEAAAQADDTRESASLVDLETLRTTEHRCHPHPGAAEAQAETAEEFAARHARFRGAEAAPGEEFSTRAATAFDPQMGITTTLDEKELTQIPLCVSRVTVSDPFLLLDTEESHPEVFGAGDDFTQARRDAAERALAAYAALAVDRRRLPDQGRRAHAADLATDETALLPAELVHPVLAEATTGAAFQPPTGLAWGADAEAALQRGLVDHCVALTVAGLARGEGRFPRLDLDGAELDAAGRRYRDLLRITEIPVEVIDVTGPLGVPVYAVCYTPRVVTYTHDLTDGLRRVLLDFQRVGSGRVHQLPVARRDRRTTVPYQGPALPGVPELTAALNRAGYRVHAAPAGHDPAATALLPTLVQVVVHA